MAAKVCITYYGMPGEGKNLTEAKRDAGKRIESALTGSYTPCVIMHRGETAIVFREPSGWCYSLLSDKAKEGQSVNLWGGNYRETMAEAKRAAIRHLAQIAFDWRTDSDEAPAIMTDESDRREFASWARLQREFQARYHDAIALGLSGCDAHAYAAKDPARPELWSSAA